MPQYNISTSQTRQMQLKGLNILIYFDKFCQKHKLTWFFCGGCCIGTIRNKGFIPWDDDVDIFMPRDDYENLKNLWIDTNEYSIQFPTKERITENQFITIHDNHTTFIKTYQKDLDINHGIALDVLPLDGCPKGFRRKTQKVWALLYSLFVVGKAPENHGRLIYFTGKSLLSIIKNKYFRYKVWNFCEKKMTQYSIQECDYITELCSGPYYMQKEYPKRCFEYSIRMEFEGYLFCMPVGYDTYLKIAFGNYMQIPPKEKQVCHHEYEILDTKNSYKLYRGKYYFKKG